jgi:hypothetical protein
VNRVSIFECSTTDNRTEQTHDSSFHIAIIIRLLRPR